MANHKSAKKRSKQTLKKTQINSILLSKIKTASNKVNISFSKKNLDVAKESLSLLNSVFARAVKRGVIKKKHASRKLSSLSKNIDKK